MSSFPLSRTAVGLAYSSYVDQLVLDEPGLIDFVETPFELLNANPTAARAVTDAGTPLILHSASLSLAGHEPPSADTEAAVGQWMARTNSPWLGEHLAFVSAADKTGEPLLDIGYAVAPCMTSDTVNRVVAAANRYGARYDRPVLLENSPIYFDMPGATMDQAQFIGEICARCPAGLLLDLSHLYITADSMGVDPLDLMLRLPLQRVVEAHVSGVNQEDGGMWDDHTARAPEIVHRMLAALLKKAPVRAVTIEYNWSVNFPLEDLLVDLARVRTCVAEAC